MNQLQPNSFPIKATLLLTSTLTVMSGATIAPSLPAMQEFFANLGDYIRTRKDPKIRPAIDIMYDDLIRQHGVLWLYSSILFVLPRLLPELLTIWLRTRGIRKYYPFLHYESLLDRSLLDIRQEFDLLPFVK